MQVAVTGATGFIGRHLTQRLLNQGHDVRVLLRDPTKQSGLPDAVRCWFGNLSSSGDKKIIQSFVDGVDVLYHCAAENNNTDRMVSTNVLGTQNLLTAASGNIGHWVHLSSVGVYGTHQEGIIAETMPMHPVNIYEQSKAEAERLIITAAEQSCFSYTLLRPSKVFGVGMSNRVLFQLINLIDKGLFFFVGLPGASANYVHVDDVIDVLLACYRYSDSKNAIYNLSDYLSVEEFVAIIAKALGKPIPSLRIPSGVAYTLASLTRFVPKNPLTQQRINALVKRAVYPTDKLQRELAYQPKVGIEQGLIELVDYYLENKSRN